MPGAAATTERAVRERVRLLVQLDHWLEKPLLVLALVWLALFLVEVLHGLSPMLEAAGYVIWAVFVLEFVIELSLAPRKRRYLARNWLKLIALLVPALRIVRVLRVLRVVSAARGARLIRVLSSLNRGLRALRSQMRKRGFGFALLSTLVVTTVGAAGMFAFEAQAHGDGFDSYGDALWWTAMLMTSLGSEYWPRSAEGRMLGLLLALYAVGVFGYITAALAAYFVGRDASEDVNGRTIAELRDELRALRTELREARDMQPPRRRE